MSAPAKSETPIRSWGTTRYSRRDYDARRPTGGSRWGRWHAFEDSNPSPGGTYALADPASYTRLAICGWMVEVGTADWLNQEDPPQGLPRRRYCQRCLRVQAERYDR